MAAYTLDSLTCSGPSAAQPYLEVTFRRPSVPSSPNPISPASGLQLALRNGDMHIYLERAAPRDVLLLANDDEEGRLMRLRVPAREVPRFRREGGRTDVVLHAWRGEKLLGSWEVGSLEGLNV